MTLRAGTFIGQVVRGEVDLGARMRYRGESNGSIYGPNAEIVGQSMLGRDCIIYGTTGLFDSAVLNTSVARDSTLINSNISHSHIKGCTLYNAAVSDMDLVNVTVLNSVLIGEWDARPGLRFDAGIWHEAPAGALIGDSDQPTDEPGIKIVISECVNGRNHIGCWCLPYEEWTRAGYRERLGRNAGWTPAQIELAFDCFTDWRRIRRNE